MQPCGPLRHHDPSPQLPFPLLSPQLPTTPPRPCPIHCRQRRRPTKRSRTLRGQLPIRKALYRKYQRQRRCRQPLQLLHLRHNLKPRYGEQRGISFAMIRRRGCVRGLPLFSSSCILLWQVKPRAILAERMLTFTFVFSSRQFPIGLIMFVLVTLVVRLLLAPSIGLMFFALLYGTFWVPQIARAVRKGRSCALEMRYMIGTTLGRGAIAGCKYLHPVTKCTLKR